MGTQNTSIFTLSILATAVIAACRFVTHAGAHAGVAGAAIGVSRSAAAEDAYVPVDVIGTVVVESGAAVAVGDLVQSDSTGRAITATASSLKQAVISGGAAGAHTVTGIAASDRLVSVVRLDVEVDTGTSASGNKVQAASALTSEFAVSAANTIDNTGGTNTTGDLLLVTWETAQPVRGRALQAASGAGKFIEVLLFNH
jgi:hypothetical protein